jgi:hypothetical protein
MSIQIITALSEYWKKHHKDVIEEVKADV